MANGDDVNALIPRDPDEIQRAGVDQFTGMLTAFLDNLDLPSGGVLVAPDERRIVMRNLPDVVARLDPDARAAAFYISKFVAACAVGLFDAALNFMWDETVSNLRVKVARFDLEYFYDSVFTDPSRRQDFSTEEHLVQLDDWQLIKGCRNIGVLSDIGYRHLDYIRDMRNWASAAHPNHVELTGLQLVGWLQTCVREVLAREPSEPAIQVKQLLHNVRTQVLAAGDIPLIAGRIAALPAEIVSSLLRAIAGMFADPAMAVAAKNNIRLIAPAVWAAASEQARHEVGLKYSRFATNADIQRRDALREFLAHVGGLSYLPADARALEISERVRAVEAAHFNFNNFYNEPVPAQALASFVPATGEVPDVVRTDYVRVLALAHIGNAYGVSWAADTYYQQLIARFQEPEIQQFVRLIEDPTLVMRLQYRGPAARFVALARQLRERTADLYTRRALDLIIAATVEQLPKLHRTGPMRQALAQLGQGAPRA